MIFDGLCVKYNSNINPIEVGMHTQNVVVIVAIYIKFYKIENYLSISICIRHFRDWSVFYLQTISKIVSFEMVLR